MRPLLLLVLPLVLVVAACGDDVDMDMNHMAGHGRNGEVAADARVIEVSATSFEFDPETIEVEAGADNYCSVSGHRGAGMEGTLVVS